METIKYSPIGKQDLSLGRSTYEVTLADGRVVAFDQINLDTFDRRLTVADAQTNSFGEALELRHTTTGTPVVGFGTSMRFTAQIPSGAVADLATILASYDIVTAGSEQSSLVFRTRQGGNALGTAWTFTQLGSGYVSLQATSTGTRIITLQDSTHTLVGRDTTDTLTNKTLTDPLVNAGGGTNTIKPAGMVGVALTPTGNGGAIETDLLSVILAASALSASGKGVRVRVGGVTAANTATKTIRVYFGATVMVSNDVTTAPNNQSWEFECEVYRTGSNVQVHVSRGSVGSVTQTSACAGLSATDTNAITIKVTGQGAASNDITAKILAVEFLN